MGGIHNPEKKIIPKKNYPDPAYLHNPAGLYNPAIIIPPLYIIPPLHIIPPLNNIKSAISDEKGALRTPCIVINMQW